MGGWGGWVKSLEDTRNICERLIITYMNRRAVVSILASAAISWITPTKPCEVCEGDVRKRCTREVHARARA